MREKKGASINALKNQQYPDPPKKRLESNEIKTRMILHLKKKSDIKKDYSYTQVIIHQSFYI